MGEELKLLVPDESHEMAWHEVLDEFAAYKEKITPYSFDNRTRDFSAYLKRTREIAAGKNLDGLVRADTYFLLDGKDAILGAINLRYDLNEYLFNFGGHIGYGIRPTQRGNGYATYMLKNVLPPYKVMGFKKVLITCNADNIASEKVILKNGGVKENEVKEENGNSIYRYWISL